MNDGGRTWRRINEEESIKIRSYLLDEGGIEKGMNPEQEKWKILVLDSTFTLYYTSTLHSTPSSKHIDSIAKIRKKIDKIKGPNWPQTNKDYLIGFDESGKGEMIGDTIVAGVLFSKNIEKDLDIIASTSNTKRKHKFEYWDKVYSKLLSVKKDRLGYKIEKISPDEADKSDLDDLLDNRYQIILNSFSKEVDISRCRVVIDNYGIRVNLKLFLDSLEEKGAEIIIEEKADERYLEVKIASIMAKRYRENILNTINNNEEYKIEGLSPGSGNANDEDTHEWLEKWSQTEKEWPSFVKRSYKTVKRIDKR